MGDWLSKAGPLGAMIAFGLGGALMVVIGLCYAELTPMMPVAGGEVAYAYGASGTRRAFLVGWSLAFGYLSVSAFEAISVGTVLSYLFPSLETWPLYELGGSTVHVPHLVLALLCTGFITAVNYVGVRWAVGLQTILTLSFLAVTLVFVATGLAGGSVDNFHPVFARWGAAGIAGGITGVFVTVPFWFVGFDTIPQGAEEAKASVPPRLLGTLILVSIAGATVFYVVLILSTSLTGPWQEITKEPLATAEAFSRTFGSRVMVNLVLVAALLGLLTSWNGFFLAGSRVLFALGRGCIVPEWLGHTHPRFGTPAKAVLLSGAVTLAGGFLGRGAMLSFVSVGSLCIAVAFVGVAQSAIGLRRTRPDLPRPYRMPGGLFFPRAALLGSLAILAFLLVPWSPASLGWPLEWIILSGFVLLGIAFWLLGAGLRTATPETQRERLILGDLASRSPSREED